jgi:hypothetical protein
VAGDPDAGTPGGPDAVDGVTGQADLDAVGAEDQAVAGAVEDVGPQGRGPG